MPNGIPITQPLSAARDYRTDRDTRKYNAAVHVT